MSLHCFLPPIGYCFILFSSRVRTYLVESRMLGVSSCICQSGQVRICYSNHAKSWGCLITRESPGQCHQEPSLPFRSSSLKVIKLAWPRSHLRVLWSLGILFLFLFFEMPCCPWNFTLQARNQRYTMMCSVIMMMLTHLFPKAHDLGIFSSVPREASPGKSKYLFADASWCLPLTPSSFPGLEDQGKA